MKDYSLGHVVFYVKDLRRSLVFYRDLLGFKEVGQAFNQPGGGRRALRLHLGEDVQGGLQNSSKWCDRRFLE